MKVVFKSNSHQSHYLFLFKISFVIGKQKTLANENVLIISEMFLKNSRKQLTMGVWSSSHLQQRTQISPTMHTT